MLKTTVPPPDQHRIGGGNEGERGNNNLVSGPDFYCRERGMLSGGAGGKRHGVFDADKFRKCLFQGLHFPSRGVHESGYRPPEKPQRLPATPRGQSSRAPMATEPGGPVCRPQSAGFSDTLQHLSRLSSGVALGRYRHLSVDDDPVMPSGYSWGRASSASSATVAGSKTTRSAAMPGQQHPAIHSLSLWAGMAVILLDSPAPRSAHPVLARSGPVPEEMSRRNWGDPG